MDPPSRLSGSPLPSETETVTESRRWVSLSKGRMPGVVDPAGGGLPKGVLGSDTQEGMESIPWNHPMARNTPNSTVGQVNRVQPTEGRR